MGYDPRFNYMKLVRAAHHLRDDSVLFLATDDDATFPLRDDMTIPGTRAVSIPIPKESQFLLPLSERRNCRSKNDSGIDSRKKPKTVKESEL